ncbi:protein translocase subunit SecD [Avibacterium paragallinarum]|uniref:Protein translocase subunit SecD n=1 Tax=Avibacterium paragallinarum TaxID=728 RepID=A0AAE5TJ93_AVIPA|nr:protein translocase subunit SecD [Avibacterium paragallinarum]MEE3608632.1 protein translocase subunit SecD [Avibacterium paragallinarum]MEE3620712.1 protein translocase subunit SecD [Avibacterium paragallinarum]MEE3668653.1 protein translocase subunit SecD [Avibacterium paragallinarum]MEE3680325.1 protein translocase subunit SecD [Avibacterium paragallinarum]MEE4385424.1 protein translocase subunit SecD [Avibacterium paragallinarum]
MLNRYPLWKNIMVILVVAIGVLYSLPNLYGEDPAVQISGTRGQEANTTTLSNVQMLLNENHLTTKSIKLENGSILARFHNTDDQLLAKDKISEKLGNNYSVALNLAPATPKWLADIGGNPMKWGLDLRGGVRFLMEVDMNTALTKRQEQLQDGLYAELRKAKYPYTNIRAGENYSTLITLKNPDQLSSLQRLLRQAHPNLVVNEVSNNTLSLALSDAALNETRDHAIEQNLSILRRRVEELGVSEPVIQRQGADRIVVELPGVQDTARAKEILGATATLEFRLVNQNANVDAAMRGMLPSDSEVKFDRNNRPVVLYKRAVLGGDHIINASSGMDQHTASPQVSVTLDSEGGDIMSQTTKMNLKKPMATLYVEYKDSGKKDENGKTLLTKHEEVINIATIQGRFGSQFQITGIDSPSEAQNLAVLLRSGALTAPIQIVEERTVGPSLGAQNVEQGLQAGLWGLAITLLFMVIYYKVFGLFASLALLANMVLLVGLMSLLPGATLTMPGIAGIILSVGMSVDANVLIFERIKEELRNGRSVQQAINEGYNGAFSSIFDANLTTILTSIVLYAVGTGPIKGFAITLSLGVAISMFTAITGTRMLVNFLYGGKRVEKLSI